MSALARKEINFLELEGELQSAIDADARYWKENDAKFRAVNQKVQTYEEFRNIVKAAHLKPLEKKDHLNVASKGCVWNTLANKANPQTGNQFPGNHQEDGASVDKTIRELPATGTQFLHAWRRINPGQHLDYLKFVVDGSAEAISSVEIPAEVFQQMICALSGSQGFEGAKLVVETLKAVAQSKRFALMKDFLNQEDRNSCAQLIQKQMSLVESLADDCGPASQLKQEMNYLTEKFL